MGKDEKGTRSKERISDTPSEMDVPQTTRRDRPGSGPIEPVGSQVGVEDEDKIIFGGIEDDLYVVEADDPRPKSLDMKGPPDLKSGRETKLDDTEDESYITRPPSEPRPGPLHPGTSKESSGNTEKD